MTNEAVILIAEDDEGHSTLIKKNLMRAGLRNKIIHFKDGQEILDFFFNHNESIHYNENESYLLLLDIRMPKVDGFEVLKNIKQNENLKKIPIIMLTTTGDPVDIEKCYTLGCNSYIQKPINYNKFIDVIKQLGFFLTIVEIPEVRSN